MTYDPADPYKHLYPELLVSVFYDGQEVQEKQIQEAINRYDVKGLKCIPFSQIDEVVPEPNEMISHLYGYVGDSDISIRRFLEFSNNILKRDQRPYFFIVSPAHEDSPPVLKVTGKLLHGVQYSQSGCESAFLHSAHKVFLGVQKGYWRGKWRELKKLSDETHEEAFQFQQEQNDFIRLTKLLRTKLVPRDVVRAASQFFKEAFQLNQSLFLRYEETTDTLILESQEEQGEDLKLEIGLRGKRNPLDYFETFVQSDEFKQALQVPVAKGFPVMAKDLPIGVFVLGVANESDFPAHHLMDQLINFFGISYLNATLHEKITEMAVRDGLTGLYNVRYFHQRINGEFNRIERLKHSLGLIFLDIDHFKKYNDTHGHPNGDKVLRQVAEIIRKEFRPTDIIARYGGEEFVVALPHATLEEARERAENLRKAIEEAPFPNEETQPLGKVTISIGVSAFPEVANDPKVLLKSADDALYIIKESTRNAVHCAEPPEGHVPLYKPKKPTG